jgi:hypothetical protein
VIEIVLVTRRVCLSTKVVKVRVVVIRWSDISGLKVEGSGVGAQGVGVW